MSEKRHQTIMIFKMYYITHCMQNYSSWKIHVHLPLDTGRSSSFMTQSQIVIFPKVGLVQLQMGIPWYANTNA